MDTALQKQLHEGGGEDGIVHPVYNAQQEGLMAFYPKDWRVVVLMLLIILVRSPVLFASVGISVLLVVFASVSALLSHLSTSVTDVQGCRAAADALRSTHDRAALDADAAHLHAARWAARPRRRLLRLVAAPLGRCPRARRLGEGGLSCRCCA